MPPTFSMQSLAMRIGMRPLNSGAWISPFSMSVSIRSDSRVVCQQAARGVEAGEHSAYIIREHRDQIVRLRDLQGSSERLDLVGDRLDAVRRHSVRLQTVSENARDLTRSPAAQVVVLLEDHDVQLR